MGRNVRCQVGGYFETCQGTGERLRRIAVDRCTTCFALLGFSSSVLEIITPAFGKSQGRCVGGIPCLELLYPRLKIVISSLAYPEGNSTSLTAKSRIYFFRISKAVLDFVSDNAHQCIACPLVPLIVDPLTPWLKWNKFSYLPPGREFSSSKQGR